MYKIIYYRDSRERQPVKDFIDDLYFKKDKRSRVLFTKTWTMIEQLSKKGLALGMPHIRKITGDIWELRPMRNRIFFFCYENDKFVLLHCYYKKSNKTPEKEIIKAINERNDYLRRN